METIKLESWKDFEDKIEEERIKIEKKGKKKRLLSLLLYIEVMQMKIGN